MSKVRRMVIHWTAGHLGPSLPFYHFLIDRAGVIVPGKFAPEANCVRPLISGQYAPHVENANGDTIGIAMVGMWDAKSPKALGTQPLLAVQWHTCVRLAADLCRKYGIEPGPLTVAGHCEVQRLWGPNQKGKWDPWVEFPEWTWVKGLTPAQIGDYFRDAVGKAVASAR
jgi:N-acetyl-anhydromuramyl-L-alanine amidase AmpD